MVMCFWGEKIWGDVFSPVKNKTMWWFQIFFIFTPKIEEMIQFDSYSSNGLKPPTSTRQGDILWCGKNPTKT